MLFRLNSNTTKSKWSSTVCAIPVFLFFFFFSIQSSLIIITFLCKGCYALNAPFNVLTILIPGNVNTWNYKQVAMSKGATILIIKSWDSSILSSNRMLGYPSSAHPGEHDGYILNRHYTVPTHVNCLCCFDFGYMGFVLISEGSEIRGKWAEICRWVVDGWPLRH